MCCAISPCGRAGIKSLENVLRRAVTEGQPRRLRAWRKILIVVEGVYRYMYVYVCVWRVGGCLCKPPDI